MPQLNEDTAARIIKALCAPSPTPPNAAGLVTTHGALADLPRLVFESVGRASMCWTPRPSGDFDTDEATTIAEHLIAEVRRMFEPPATEAQLRAAAHALTVRADRLAAAARDDHAPD